MLRITCCLLILSALSGCVNECQAGTSVCEGNSLKTCVSQNNEIRSSRTYWETSKCDVACAIIEGSGTCVASAAPVPECAHDGDHCRNGGISHCHGGYVISAFNCEDGLQCAETSCGAMCVRETVAEPRCSPDPTHTPPLSSMFCDNNDVVSCQCGYVFARDACGASGQCKTINTEVQCVSSPTPDPRCGDPTRESFGFCDGNVAYSCWYGFVVGSAGCGTGRCVLDAQLGVSCQWPASRG
jgi:hypothetical protein